MSNITPFYPRLPSTHLTLSYACCPLLFRLTFVSSFVIIDSLSSSLTSPLGLISFFVFPAHFSYALCFPPFLARILHVTPLRPNPHNCRSPCGLPITLPPSTFFSPVVVNVPLFHFFVIASKFSARFFHSSLLITAPRFLFRHSSFTSLTIVQVSELIPYKSYSHCFILRFIVITYPNSPLLIFLVPPLYFTLFSICHCSL